MKKIKVIGLTGLYCAGKNHAAGILSDRGLPVIDADKLGHSAIETEKSKIFSRFGNDILGKDGAIDRKLLGEKVFGKPTELAALEGIIHPAVDKEINAWIETRKENACVINAALLHRTSLFKTLYAIIIVEAPFFTRLLRAKKGISFLGQL
jgi:dephospho-CoA kinase